jgi:hypothetical protein
MLERRDERIQNGIVNAIKWQVIRQKINESRLEYEKKLQILAMLKWWISAGVLTRIVLAIKARMVQRLEAALEIE